MEKKNYRQGCDVQIELIRKTDETPVRCDFYRVVGQDAAKNKLAFFLKSNSPNSPMPTFLFTGSHGLGKTYMAGTIANSLGRRFIEVNCQTLETTKDLVEKILLDKVIGEKPVTLLLDEAHRLNDSVTTLLLTLLSPNKSGKNLLEYKDCRIVFDLTRINTIFATTDSFKIFPALVNRCETIYFHQYNNKELIEMLRMYLPDIVLKCSEEEIAYACRGRGRDAYLLAQKVKRYCGSQNISVIDSAGWEYLKSIFGIHELGLNDQELDLMNIISASGIISCSSIATKMMISEEAVEAEIEPRPRELGLITNSSRGRQLTPEGIEYLKNVKVLVG